VDHLPLAPPLFAAFIMASMPRPALLASLFLVSLLGGPVAFAQKLSLCPAFDKVLVQHGVVGGAIAVVHGAAPPESCFYGNARQATHQPIDAATSYNWASITKTMTAIAILQLRDRGRLSLDDPAVRYIPELRQVHDAFGPMDAVTIRTLLTHSAGFRNPTWPWDCDDSANCDWQPFEPTLWSQIVAMLPYTHVAFAPGTRWSYSNLGYVFLGQIIERLTGDDFEVYLTKNILMPLGMTQSYFDHSPYFLLSHVSNSYLRAGDKLTEQPFNFDTGITTSNSGLKSPVTDMAKYVSFLLGIFPKAPLDAVVLRRSSLEEAWKGVLPVADPGQPSTPYTTGAPQMGLGFFIAMIDGHRYVYHDGDQGGFSSEMFLDPERHIAALLVVNTTETGAPPPNPATHAESNTEPNPATDLRLTLRRDLIDRVFPQQSRN
jgi:CubicO group peptidase (beta-lactamase class C family)